MDFAGQIPAAASTLIHGIDLSGQIDTLNASTPDDIVAQIAPAAQPIDG